MSASKVERTAEDVEKVARAIAIPQHHTTWDTLTDAEKDLFYMQADYAIRAMAVRPSDDVIERAVIEMRKAWTNADDRVLRVLARAALEAMGASSAVGWQAIESARNGRWSLAGSQSTKSRRSHPMSASKVERTAEDVERRVARAIWDAHKALTWPAHPAHGTTAYVKIPLEMAACESLARAALEAMGASSDVGELIEELQSAAELMRELPTAKKQEMESITGFSADAIAYLYDKCRTTIESLTTGGNDGE